MRVLLDQLTSPLSAQFGSYLIFPFGDCFKASKALHRTGPGTIAAGGIA